mmetsp:Transcript_52966/g.84193  ORF Transcript_52966/g.84193 Transcript_52966/m.84193 type:complete len:283 (+) Transcript_52966:31-879(+)
MVQSSLILLCSLISTSLETVDATTPAVTATDEVPLFFHFTEYANLICNGTAYTDDPLQGCNGWPGISDWECKMKCHRCHTNMANCESVGKCGAKRCRAAVFYEYGNVCQLFESSQCRGLVAKHDVTTFRKEHPDDPGLPGQQEKPQVNAAGLALGVAAGLTAMHELLRGGATQTSVAPALLAPKNAATSTVAPNLGIAPSGMVLTTTAAATLGSSSFDVGFVLQLFLVVCGICCIAAVCQARGKSTKRKNRERCDDAEEREAVNTSSPDRNDVGDVGGPAME